MKNPLASLNWHGVLADPRLTGLVTAVLVIWLGFSAAQLTWRLLPAAQLPPVPAAPAAESAASAAGKRTDLTAVAALHLLGRPQQRQAQAPVRAVEAPETRLNLTLKGVFTHEDPRQAFAIIAAPGKPDRPYRVGDTVVGGAQLAEVHKDRVLLERNQRYETLRLPQGKLSLPSGAELAPRRTETAAAGPAASSQQLREYREQLLERPSEAWKLARMHPVMEDGRLKGYKLNPGRDPRFFQQLGLRPGDVVTSVNGIPLSDPAQVGSILEQISNADRLNLDVEQNGSSRSLHLDFTH